MSGRSKFYRYRQLLAASVSPLVLLHGGWAMAQGVPQPPATAAAAAAPGSAAEPAPATGGAQLQEVVVTAQRRSENLQRAAVAVAVVSPTDLLNAGVVTSATLNAVVPALAVAQAGGANTSYFIRGVGNFTVNAYADPAVAFNYDGVYIGRPTSTTAAFYDLERIEVLKGPQGILYGRNATGGAINVIPAKPSLSGFSGYATASVGNYDSKDFEGAVNLPITSDTAIRASGKVVHNGGYNDDGTSDQVGEAGRIQFLYKPQGNLTVRLAADYAHQGGVGPGASLNGIMQYVPGAPATGAEIANYRFIAAPSTLGPYSGLHTGAEAAYFSTLTIGGAFIHPAASLYPSLDNVYYGANAEITLKTDFGTLTWIPAFRDSRLKPLFNGPDFYGALTPEHDKQFSSEIRLEGAPIGPLDWLVGGYYYDEHNAARYTFDQYQLNEYQSVTASTVSLAGFARLAYHVSDRLRLVGGARYTQDQKHFSVTADTLIEICAIAPPPFGPGCFGGPTVPLAPNLASLNLQPSPPPNGPPVPYGTYGNLLLDGHLVQNTSKTFNRLTYRGALEYDLAPRSLAYLSYETGFRSGGFSASASYPSFNPEYIKAATLGIKNRLFDNRVQLNVEAYHWDYTNQQVTHFGVEKDGSANLFTQNLGASTIQGLDVDGQGLVMENTLLRGSVQYLNNKINSFVFTNPYGGNNTPPVTGCAVTTPANAAAPQVYTINCSGHRGYNSPEWSVNAGVDHTIRFSNAKLVLSADVRYRSNRVLGFEQLAQQTSGDDTTLDLTAHFAPDGERWSLTAYMQNVTDVAVATASQYAGQSGGTISTNYAPPRTYGVRVAAKF